MKHARAAKPCLLAASALTLLTLAWLSPGLAATAQTATPIRHIVVLYMENHSFDNVLGFWCDRNPGRCSLGGMPPTVRLSNGAVVKPSVAPDTVPFVNHNVATQLAAMNIQGGVPRMNGWQNIPDGSCDAATRYQCVSGYQPSQIPNLAKLAQDFAISDATFSMGDSPSWGGHLYAAMSSLDGFMGNNPVPAPGTSDRGWGCNHTSVSPWVSPTGQEKWIPSCIPDPSLRVPNGGAFEPTPASWAPTIFDRLQRAGLSWDIYDGVDGASFGGWSICPSLADCWYTKQRSQVTGTNQFAAAAAGGTLPAFSIITPGGANTLYSQHNGMSMTAGDNFIGKITRELMQSPEWSSTALFISYDDCGCFYDQVPPGVNADGTQRGPRIPLVIVSPYAKAGFTDSTPTTFAGILAYVEHNFGLSPLGANDASAYDLRHAFNYAQTPRRPVGMVTRPLPPSARHIRLTPALLNDPT